MSNLLWALKNEKGSVQSNAAHALGGIGKPAVPFLIGALGNKDRKTRSLAVVALGEVGPDAREAIHALNKVAAEDCPYVQFWAKRAIKQIEGK
jgi:hypothetical protein